MDASYPPVKTDRTLPMFVAAGCALFVHMVLLLTTILAMRTAASAASIQLEPANLPRQRPKPGPSAPPQVHIGRANEPERLTAAWIAHDDFRQLIAPEAVDQPALQQKAEPIEQAVARLDPTEVPPPRPMESRPTTTLPAAEEHPNVTVANPAAPPAHHDKPLEVEGAPPTSELTVVSPRDLASAARSDPAPTDPDPRAQPTYSPRSDREASPSVRIDAGRFRPGGMLVSQGIEIKTIAPRFRVVWRYSAPNNPKVLLVFNPNGEVVEARVLRSSGYVGIDSAVLSSLYLWHASGPQLQKKAQVEIRLVILLQ